MTAVSAIQKEEAVEAGKEHGYGRDGRQKDFQLLQNEYRMGDASPEYEHANAENHGNHEVLVRIEERFDNLQFSGHTQWSYRLFLISQRILLLFSFLTHIMCNLFYCKTLYCQKNLICRNISLFF